MAKIQLNGKKISLKNRTSIKQLLLKYKLLNKRVAIELNGKIIPSTKYKIYLKDKDIMEIVTLLVEDNMKSDLLKIGGKKFKSRLIVGTGKYKSFKETKDAILASKAEIVTVAVRRVNILDKKKPLLTDYLDPKKILYLPNTAGCFNSKDALRTLRLAREMGGWKLVKLEVLGDKRLYIPIC